MAWPLQKLNLSFIFHNHEQNVIRAKLISNHFTRRKSNFEIYLVNIMLHFKIEEHASSCKKVARHYVNIHFIIFSSLGTKERAT